MLDQSWTAVIDGLSVDFTPQGVPFDYCNRASQSIDYCVNHETHCATGSLFASARATRYDVERALRERWNPPPDEDDYDEFYRC